jgi:Zinc finger, C2H2 type
VYCAKASKVSFNYFLGKRAVKEQTSREKSLVKCPHCSKAYTRKDNLKYHIKREHSVCSIHEEVQSRCQDCRECLVCCGGQCLEERTFTCSNCACEVPNAEMRQHLLVQPCQTCGVHYPCSTAYTSHWQNGQCLMPTISKEVSVKLNSALLKVGSGKRNCRKIFSN